jgi:hypothetical protein
MRTILAIGTMLGVLALAGSAAGSSLAELSATMGTSNALSSGAADGASTAHAAMASVLRNLPTTTSGLPSETTQAAHAQGGSGWVNKSSGGQGSGHGWATASSSSSGTSGGWMTVSSNSRGGSGGWATASSARQSTGTSAWSRAGDQGSPRRH